MPAANRPCASDPLRLTLRTRHREVGDAVLDEFLAVVLESPLAVPAGQIALGVEHPWPVGRVEDVLDQGASEPPDRASSRWRLGRSGLRRRHGAPVRTTTPTSSAIHT